MIDDFFQLLFTVLIIMDPIGSVPAFISAAAGFGETERHKVIKKAILVAAIVLLIFILGGGFILSFFGISPGAFYISGGILFLFISIDMIYGQKPPSRVVTVAEDEDSSSLAVFPLAIPLIAGPGLITKIMLFVSGGYSWPVAAGMLVLAVGFSLAVEYIALRSSLLILKVLGKTGVSVVEKIMGLILSGLSIQLMYEGFVKLGIFSGL